jgi:hypothetical protein
VGGERGFAEGERFGRLAAHNEQASQMAARPIRVSMCLAARLLINHQRALQQHTRDQRRTGRRSRRAALADAVEAGSAPLVARHRFAVNDAGA